MPKICKNVEHNIVNHSRALISHSKQIINHKNLIINKNQNKRSFSSPIEPHRALIESLYRHLDSVLSASAKTPPPLLASMMYACGRVPYMVVPNNGWAEYAMDAGLAP